MVRAAAWSVPVVAAAAAAPAFAASPCATSTVVWATGWAGTGGVIASGTTRTQGNAVVTLTYSGDTGAANNATIFTSGQTGGVANALRFYDENNVINTSQTVTITFDKQVRNVSFTLLDVDSALSGNSRFFDQVRVVTSGYAYVNGSQVQGAGTTTNQFRATGTNTQVAGTATTGNVTLSWAGDVTSVQFVYSQGGTANASPFVGISNLTFQAQDC